MAYYTALIAAWNNVTQPPSGVTGTALTGGMTTAQKLAAVNAWTVAAPQAANIPVSSIIGAIAPADFLALTALQLQELQFLLQAQTVLAPPSGTIRSVFSTIFAGKATTLANLNALVAPFDNATNDWCNANGYPSHGSSGPGNLSPPDCSNAGLV